MMGMMYMHFYWGCNFIFLFNSWESQSGQCGKFVWYMVLAFVMTVLTDLIPFFKESLISKRNRQISFDGEMAEKGKIGFIILLVILQTAWILLSICIMLLIMSFNYGMVITILCTKTAIYCFTGLPKLLKSSADISCIVKTEDFNGACH